MFLLHECPRSERRNYVEAGDGRRTTRLLVEDRIWPDYATVVEKNGTQPDCCEAKSMRDSNDNNVDDNIENLAKLGGLIHLQGQQQAHQQRTKEIHELQRLRHIAEREERARKAEENRIKELPQCPACGGRLEGQFRKCKGCASDLSWVEGIPCEPGKEHEIHEWLREEREQTLRREEASKQRRLQLEKEQQQKWESLQSEMDQLTNGLPDNCPKCSHPRPGYPRPRPSTEQHSADHLAYAENWAQTTRQHGCCPVCLRKDIDSQRHKLENRIIAGVVVLCIVILIVFAVALSMANQL